MGEQIDIQIHFSEAVSTTAANILKATLETGSTNADEELTYGAIDNATVATVTYTVGEDDYNAALTMKSPVVVSGGQKVNDQAGTLGTANEMTTKTIPDGKNLADEVVDIFVDGEYPVDDGTAITVTPKGGNVVSGKFNTTNTSADFGVKLSGAKLGTGTAQSDITLVGGTVQMHAKINPNGWASIGDPYTITSNDVNASLATVNVLERPLEGLNGFATGASIIFKATVTDRAANAKDWAESSNQLEIDVAKLLKQHIPSAEQVRFGKNGADATTAAVKIASVPVASSGAWNSILPITSSAAMSVSPVCSVSETGLSSPVAVCFNISPLSALCVNSTSLSVPNFIVAPSVKDNFPGVTELSVGVTVPPLSEPSSMAKKLVLAAGAVVNVSVLDDTVKSVPGFCITPPRDKSIWLTSPTVTLVELTCIVCVVSEPSNPDDMSSSCLNAPDCKPLPMYDINRPPLLCYRLLLPIQVGFYNRY